MITLQIKLVEFQLQLLLCYAIPHIIHLPKVVIVLDYYQFQITTSHLCNFFQCLLNFIQTFYKSLEKLQDLSMQQDMGCSTIIDLVDMSKEFFFFSLQSSILLTNLFEPCHVPLQLSLQSLKLLLQFLVVISFKFMTLSLIMQFLRGVSLLNGLRRSIVTILHF